MPSTEHHRPIAAPRLRLADPWEAVAGSPERDSLTVKALVERLTSLPAVCGGLCSCSTVGELFATAATEACITCNFDRAVVLAVRNGELVAEQSSSVGDPASELLSRQLLARPLPLRPRSVEAELLRKGSSTCLPARGDSVLASELGLTECALAAVSPGGDALAILAVDRLAPKLSTTDHTLVSAFAATLAVALAQVILRERAVQVQAELHRIGTGILHKLNAPLALGSPEDDGDSSPRTDPFVHGKLRDLLTERELLVAPLLVEGLSNPEIADRLGLASETVKAHVARILRKLNASNRADAVARMFRMSG
jgi:DNA-binding CsgD family transcriptional regulator